MKSKSVKNSRKAKKAKLVGHGRGPEGPTGRFWTMWIKPRGAALIAERLMPCHFVIKNLGSNNIMLVALQGDKVDVSPGGVRATYAHGLIRVENSGEKPVPD